LFETITGTEETQARYVYNCGQYLSERREGWFESISAIFESSIENIMTDGRKHTESGVLCRILCHMLNFITRTKILGSITAASSSKQKVQSATIFELCDRLLLPDLNGIFCTKQNQLVRERQQVRSQYVDNFPIFRFADFLDELASV
jgi:hypothetical protein